MPTSELPLPSPSMGLVEAAQLGLLWRIARRVAHVRSGGAWASHQDVDPLEAPSVPATPPTGPQSEPPAPPHPPWSGDAIGATAPDRSIGLPRTPRPTPSSERVGSGSAHCLKRGSRPAGRALSWARRGVVLGLDGSVPRWRATACCRPVQTERLREWARRLRWSSG